MADQIISELEIYCPNRSKGCKWEGAMQGAANHVSSNCKFAGELPKWFKEYLENHQEVNPGSLDDEVAPQISLMARVYAKQQDQGKLQNLIDNTKSKKTQNDNEIDQIIRDFGVSSELKARKDHH